MTACNMDCDANRHLRVVHLRQLYNEPFVSLAIILHEGVAVCVQNGRALLGFFVACHNFGPVLGQGKIVPVFLCAIGFFHPLS